MRFPTKHEVGERRVHPGVADNASEGCEHPATILAEIAERTRGDLFEGQTSSAGKSRDTLAQSFPEKLLVNR